MPDTGAQRDSYSSFKPARPKDQWTWVRARRRWRRALMRRALLLAFNTVAMRRKAYQPLEIGGHKRKATREFEHRWDAVALVLTKYRVASVLDIGSAEGALVRRAAADLGCFALGVEATDRLVAGELARLHDDIERVSAMRAMLSAEDVLRLPRFDAVVCLSVVHHIIRSQGLEGGRSFVRAMASRADKVFIFEIGTSEEPVGSAPRHLPAMPDGQEVFVREFLESCGLQNIVLVAETEGYAGVSRRLFSAEPSR